MYRRLRLWIIFLRSLILTHQSHSSPFLALHSSSACNGEHSWTIFLNFISFFNTSDEWKKASEHHRTATVVWIIYHVSCRLADRSYRFLYVDPSDHRRSLSLRFHEPSRSQYVAAEDTDQAFPCWSYTSSTHSWVLTQGQRVFKYRLQAIEATRGDGTCLRHTVKLLPRLLDLPSETMTRSSWTSCTASVPIPSCKPPRHPQV